MFKISIHLVNVISTYYLSIEPPEFKFSTAASLPAG